MADMDQILDWDGVQLHYADSGVGQPLLLRSGGHGLRDYLGEIAAGLASHVRVVRLDPRGCGDSTPDEFYDDATSILDMERLRIHLGIDRWIVAGHSHGAHQTLRYALTFPGHVRGVIYIAGIGLQRERSWSEAYHAGIEQGGDRDVPDGTFEANPDANRLGNVSYAEFVRRPSLWREIADLRTPFLAITGERDIRPDWPVRQLVELLPNATLLTIREAPHDLWYTHPRELQQHMMEFLETLG